MLFEVWLVFVVTEFLLSLTPGPAVMMVVAHGLRSGVRVSNWSALGILFTNACYFALSALGLGTLLLASVALFTMIKWLGVIYLVWLGGKMIRYAGQEMETTSVTAAHQPWRVFSQGIALQAGNPKAILFFVALLPQFVSPEMPILPQFLIMGVSSIVMEWFILLGYGWLAEKMGRWFTTPRARMIQERTGGVFLITAAIGLAAVHRSS